MLKLVPYLNQPNIYGVVYFVAECLSPSRALSDNRKAQSTFLLSMTFSLDLAVKSFWRKVTIFKL
jgi:hypothetical protein